LADPLHQPGGRTGAVQHVDELVLHGGGPRVQDEDQRSFGHCSAPSTGRCDWMAVIATVLTMSSTSAPRDRSFTGLRRPCSTGPIAIAPALRCTALSVLLPVLRSGKISTVALPATFESGILALATVASTAASY